MFRLQDAARIDGAGEWTVFWKIGIPLGSPGIGMEQAGIAFAASVVVLFPALMVFLAGQDYLEQGIISTALKE